MCNECLRERLLNHQWTCTSCVGSWKRAGSLHQLGGEIAPGGEDNRDCQYAHSRTANTLQIKGSNCPSERRARERRCASQFDEATSELNFSAIIQTNKASFQDSKLAVLYIGTYTNILAHQQVAKRTRKKLVTTLSKLKKSF